VIVVNVSDFLVLSEAVFVKRRGERIGVKEKQNFGFRA
jgi:hypothetical protein